MKNPSKHLKKSILEVKSGGFFKDKNSWVEEKINNVKKTKEPDIIMDAELEIKDFETEKNEMISVNLTILPL